MSLFALFIKIVIIGLAVYVINRWFPIPPAFKTLVYVVGIIVAVVFVLNAMGVHIGSGPAVPQLQ